jgi:hypothetical protein
MAEYSSAALLCVNLVRKHNQAASDVEDISKITCKRKMVSINLHPAHAGDTPTLCSGRTRIWPGYRVPGLLSGQKLREG